MKDHLNVDQIAAAAVNRWGEVIRSLTADLEPAMARVGRHVPCPMHGGKDGFRLFPDFEKTGGGCCNTCGMFSDGFALLQAVNGWQFRETLGAVAGQLGMTDASVPRPRPETKRRLAEPVYGPNPVKLQEKLRDVWNASIELTDQAAEPARRYLQHRGGLMDAFDGVDTVRFHPSLAAWDIGDDDQPVKLGEFPAIVSAVVDAKGRSVSIHRTYITSEGYKAPIDKPKKLMMSPYGRGALVGGAIPMRRPSTIMGVAEGLETAAAVTVATDMVVWPCISAQLMESFVPPSHVEGLVIWADLDRNSRGDAAARVLKQRMWESNIRCAVMLPGGTIPTMEKSIDWNDVWVHQGLSGFPDTRRRAHSAA